ncbi:hypothetical protein MMH89_01370 [Candidatus Comchoanobacter bicostacola]|uniref:N-acetyltransferase domain-containing protein n=1 Tax=Candidatus Comchoanobacter bicostacola TaxID=2919598 RepID=A0ABY5DKL0_9GAMM|nr:hypothetical protein [Candidatus Comchoanobacter bicostacola]UTC24801.1 hypothetical protein MMH89_01370 [Candidatus Comchoanobacter bicostacola]
MLVTKRKRRSETLLGLLYDYCGILATGLGSIDDKESSFAYHTGLTLPYFNIVASRVNESNHLEIQALIELAKQQEQPFTAIFNCKDQWVKQGLGEDLIMRGSITGMMCKIGASLKSYEAHPAAKLVEVNTQELFYEWVHVFCQSYDLPIEDIERVFAPCINDSVPLQLHIVQIYQKTIACCVTLFKEDKALLLWDTVLPMYRRQGIGNMMMLGRMKLCSEHQCSEVYSFGMHASKDSLQSIGFKKVGRYDLYRYDKPLEEDKRG